MFIKVAGERREWSGATASPTLRRVGRTLAENPQSRVADIGISTVSTSN